MVEEKEKKDTKKTETKKKTDTKKQETKKKTQSKKTPAKSKISTKNKEQKTQKKPTAQKKTDTKKEVKEQKKKEVSKTKEEKPKVKKEIKQTKKEKEEKTEKPKKKKVKKKIKPKLPKELESNLKIRSDIKKRTPKFRREEWFRYKKIKKNWRRPDGIHSKMRINLKYRPARVRIGFRGPKTTRGLHSSGFEEIMVYNKQDLEKIDPKTQAARIGGSVGTKKRINIEKKAEELNIRILNIQHER